MRVVCVVVMDFVAMEGPAFATEISSGQQHVLGDAVKRNYMRLCNCRL